MAAFGDPVTTTSNSLLDAMADILDVTTVGPSSNGTTSGSFHSSTEAILLTIGFLVLVAMFVACCVYLRVKVWHRRLTNWGVIDQQPVGGVVIQQPTMTVVNTTTTTCPPPGPYQPYPPQGPGYGQPQAQGVAPQMGVPPMGAPPVYQPDFYNAGYDQENAQPNFRPLPPHLPPYHD